MANAQMMDQVGRVLSDRYRIVSPVGQGASAMVFQAEDISLRRVVAVKLLHQQLSTDTRFVERFRSEAHLAASLNHRHLLAVYDWGFDDVPFLVTEYLAGGSLQAMFDDGVRLTRSQTLLVTLQAAKALEYAHRRGVVHRDIKPSNLLFDDEGQLRVADFGLARALAEASVTEIEGTVVGTARYAAPEQAQTASVDGRADVYSLGLVAIEAVTGEVPLTADTTVGTMMNRVNRSVDVPPDLGPLVPALTGSGQREVLERSTAADLAADLLQAAELLPAPEPLPLVGTDIAEAAPLAATEHGRYEPKDPTHAPTSVITTVQADSEPTGSAPVFSPTAQVEAVSAPPLVDGVVRSTPDQIAAQNAPELVTSFPLVALAVVMLAGMIGAVWFFFVRDDAQVAAVPEVIGIDYARIDEVVGNTGWNVVRLEDRVEGAVENEIVRQSPEPGTELASGDDFRVTVSIGEPAISVPSVSGLSETEAAIALDEAGFVLGPVTYENSSDVAEGLVIRANSPSSEMPKGEAIPLVISSGRVKVNLPTPLVGLKQDEATAQLEAALFVPVVQEEHSFSVDEGLVISTNPEAGTQAPEGAEIVVVVSIGPEMAEIPETKDKSVEEATDLLKEAGFCIDEVDGSPDTEVLTTDPPGGSEHRLDECIRIVTREN